MVCKCGQDMRAVGRLGGAEHPLGRLGSAELWRCASCSKLQIRPGRENRGRVERDGEVQRVVATVGEISA